MSGEKGRVTAFQFFAFLFVSRMLIVLFVNGTFAGGDNFLDNTISCLLAAVLNVALAVPLFFLYREQPLLSVPERSVQLLGRAGRAVPVYYAAYYLVIDVVYLSLFQMFMANAMEPNAVAWTLGVITVAAACYAAVLGIEAILRTAVILLVVMLLGTLLVLGGLAGQMEPLHFRPLFLEGPRQTLQGWAMLFGFGTELPTIAILLPHVKGKRTRGFLWWNVLTYGFTALLLLATVAACGDYLDQQLFPMYTAASVAHLSIFERMDIMFIIAWMSGLFVKLSADLYIIRQCAAAVSERADHPAAIVTAGAVIAVGTQVVFQSLAAQKAFLNLWCILALSLLSAVGVPLLLLGVRRYRKKRREAQRI